MKCLIYFGMSSMKEGTSAQLSGRGELHGGARVTTLVTLRKCTLGNKREIKTLKFVLAPTKGFKGGLAWIKPSKKDMAVTFSYSPAPRNQERAVSWATWLKNEFRGHLAHLQPPTFYGFQASESPNDPRRPPYQWSLGAAGGPASPRTVGAKGGSTRVPGAKKRFFPKLLLDHLGCSNKCF